MCDSATTSRHPIQSITPLHTMQLVSLISSFLVLFAAVIPTSPQTHRWNWLVRTGEDARAKSPAAPLREADSYSSSDMGVV